MPSQVQAYEEGTHPSNGGRPEDRNQGEEGEGEENVPVTCDKITRHTHTSGLMLLHTREL